MPEELGVVLEAPAETTIEPAEPSEPESGTEPEGQEPPEPQGQEKPAGQSQIAADPKHVHQAVRSSLAELQKTNPNAAAELKRAYYAAADFKKEFPAGGLVEARELKQAVAQYGGVDSLKESMGDLSFFKELDGQFTAGDPKFVEKIAEAAPESFVKMYPTMADKMEALAPEAFASWFANRSLADMGANGLIDGARWLLRVAGDNADAKGFAEQVLGYAQRMQEFAKKPIAAPANLKPAAPNNIDKRERELNIREFRSAHQNHVSSAYASELSKQLAGRTPTPDQKAAIAELVSAALTRAETQQDRDKIDRYFSAGDKDGYLRLKKSILDRSLAKAVESAVGVTMGRKPGPKPVAQVAKPTNGRTPQPAAKGIKEVETMPAHNDVDWRKTSQKDVLAGLYTLRTGGQVQWRG